MSRARDLKVGLFVLGGLVLAAVCIFLIGDERRLFNPSVPFKAEFADVEGLKGGAPIQMGGIDVGHVGTVGYAGEPTDATIYVTLLVVRSEAGRIKTDSKVRIVTKGLLGDRMIEVVRGHDPTAETLRPGSKIPTDTEPDFMKKMAGIGDKASEAIGDVQRITKGLSDEKLQRDVHESVASMNNVLKQLSEGDGYPHRFITDRAEADRITHAIENLDRTSTELTATLGEVRQIVARVKGGPGFAHDMIYGDGPQKQIEQFGGAAQEVTAMLQGVRQSDSLAHDALYGGKGNGVEAIANITALTADLRAVTANVRAGKGTLGALMVDPSVYEDLKVVLGNVQRNDVLRALVRYSIKQDEKKPVVEVGK